MGYDVAVDLQARLDRSLRNMHSITNVELEARDSLWVQDDNFTSTSAFFFIASGEKYRTECNVSTSTTNTVQVFQTAFDGTVGSSFHTNMLYMTQGDKDEPGDRSPNPLNPLIMPFLFLSKDSDSCPGCRLRFKDILSREALPNARFTNAIVSNGVFHASIVGPVVDGRTTSWKISMETNGNDFTPDSITRIIPGEGEQRYRLTSYTNLGRAWFPSQIEYQCFTYPISWNSTPVLTGLTVLVSAKIPEAISNSVFRLDESRAKTIWNNDKKQAVKVSGELRKSHHRRVIVRIATLTLFVICSVVFFVVITRYTKK